MQKAIRDFRGLRALKRTLLEECTFFEPISDLVAVEPNEAYLADLRRIALFASKDYLQSVLDGTLIPREMLVMGGGSDTQQSDKSDPQWWLQRFGTDRLRLNGLIDRPRAPAEDTHADDAVAKEAHAKEAVWVGGDVSDDDEDVTMDLLRQAAGQGNGAPKHGAQVSSAPGEAPGDTAEEDRKLDGASLHRQHVGARSACLSEVSRCRLTAPAHHRCSPRALRQRGDDGAVGPGRGDGR